MTKIKGCCFFFNFGYNIPMQVNRFRVAFDELIGEKNSGISHNSKHANMPVKKVDYLQENLGWGFNILKGRYGGTISKTQHTAETGGEKIVKTVIFN